MMKRLGVFAVLVFFLATSVFPSEYKIRSYAFEIDHKSRTYAVESLIAGDEGTAFESEEALRKALDEKIQILSNTRVFKSASYAYDLAEEEVDVTFTIKDAHTILVVPYPKYDSNYGTKLGVKMFNSNVAGTLANFTGAVDLTFPDGSWDKPTFGVDLQLDDLMFPNGSVLDVRAMGQGKEGELQKYDTSFSLKDVPLSFIRFNTDARLRTLDEGELRAVGFSIDGIGFNGVTITPSLSIADYTEKVKKSFITPALTVDGIELGRLKPSFLSEFTLKKNVAAGEDFYSSYMYSLTTMLELTEIASLKTTFQDYLWNDQPGKFRLLNELGYILTSDSTVLVQGNMYLDEEMIPDFFDAGIGVRQKIRIGNKISVTPQLIEYLRYYFPETLGDSGEFAHFYSLSATAKGNYINWKGNFREGVRYSITLNESWKQNYTTRRIMDGCYDHLEVEGHTVLFKYFNPSARVIMNYANNGIDDDNDYNWLMFDKETTMGEYLRGIRNKDISDRNMFATVVNVNLMSYFPMPSIFDFVDCYANAFFDYGCVKETETSAVKNYYAAGLEGIGILKDYPSYPVRVSVGLDLQKFKAYLNKEGGSNFYEIFIGLGFFF